MNGGEATYHPLKRDFRIMLAGYYGLDSYLLPRLGTPWQRESSEEAVPEGKVKVQQV